MHIRINQEFGPAFEVVRDGIVVAAFHNRSEAEACIRGEIKLIDAERLARLHEHKETN